MGRTPERFANPTATAEKITPTINPENRLPDNSKPA